MFKQVCLTGPAPVCWGKEKRSQLLVGQENWEKKKTRRKRPTGVASSCQEDHENAPPVVRHGNLGFLHAASHVSHPFLSHFIASWRPRKGGFVHVLARSLAPSHGWQPCPWGGGSACASSLTSFFGAYSSLWISYCIPEKQYHPFLCHEELASTWVVDSRRIFFLVFDFLLVSCHGCIFFSAHSSAPKVARLSWASA